MSITNAFASQIKNRNFLSPIGFKFTINRVPKVSFFGNSVNIPGLTLGLATQPTYLKDIDLPGDKVIFDDLNLRFLVDENLENYVEIQKWIRGLGYPESLAEIYNFQNENENLKQPDNSQLNLYSDATLVILNSNQVANFKLKFKDIFPYSLSALQFDASDTDVQYFTADVTFKYTIYNITDMSGDPL